MHLNYKFKLALYSSKLHICTTFCQLYKVAISITATLQASLVLKASPITRHTQFRTEVVHLDSDVERVKWYVLLHE